MIKEFLKAWEQKSFRFFILLIVAGTAVLCAVMYAIFDTVPPYKYDVANSYIVPSPAMKNDQMLTKWKLINNPSRYCQGANRRELFDPLTNVIIAQYDVGKAARSSSIEHGYVNISFTLPRNIPTGKIGYRARIKYQCNWLQRLFPDAFAFDTVTPDLFFYVE